MYKTIKCKTPNPSVIFNLKCKSFFHIVFIRLTSFYYLFFLINTSVKFTFFTDEGRVYKVVQWYNDEGVPGSALLDIFDIMPGLPITAMEISRKVCFLSSSHIFKWTPLSLTPLPRVVLKNTWVHFNGEHFYPSGRWRVTLDCDFTKTNAHMAFDTGNYVYNIVHIVYQTRRGGCVLVYTKRYL